MYNILVIKMQRKEKVVIWSIAALFLVLAVISGFLVGEVEINYSLSDYLDDSKGTKTALNIVNEEFGMVTDIKVMVSHIQREEAAELSDKLSRIDGVLFVNFNADSDKSYKDDRALFTVMVEGDEYSANANSVLKDIEAALEAEYGDRADYGGAVVSTNKLKDTITGEMGYILLVAVLLVIAILLLTARSWLEPFVLLFASGIAIIINLGTNFVFGDISYITNSVAAILQLALSIDYSIALLHTYRKARGVSKGGYKTMVGAVKTVAKPIAASALTTIAGLFALLFMSFGIGVDLGAVLIKGVFISLVASLSLFPTLILLFEGLMDKTAKRGLSFSGKGLCRFALKASRTVIPVFVALVVLCFFVKNGLDFSYTTNLGSESPISKYFGSNSSVVAVYENEENGINEEKEFVHRLENIEKSDGSPALLGYTGYSNTVAKEYTAAEAAELLSVSEEEAGVLFALLGITADKNTLTVSTADFILYANELIKGDERISAMIGEDTRQGVELLAELVEGDELLYNRLSAPLDYEAQTLSLGRLSQGLLDVGPTEELVAGVYAMYMAQNSPEKLPTASAKELLAFVAEQTEGGLISDFIDEKKTEQLAKAKDYLATAEGMFLGENHSMLLLSLDLPAESDDTTAFMKAATKEAEEVFGNAYLAGLIPSTYDLMSAFSYDNTLITALTVISVFLIVSIIFRSLSLPIVLVAIIQGAIWFAMSAMCVAGRSEFFMSYIMSNCILMGATIDYGILMSNGYLSARSRGDRADALETAVEGALPTVFTSGLTMIIAGFVIFFISSQNAIADTGLIIGVGTLASCLFITLALPSILYRLDGFIVKLTIRGKEKNPDSK